MNNHKPLNPDPIMSCLPLSQQQLSVLNAAQALALSTTPSIVPLLTRVIWLSSDAYLGLNCYAALVIPSGV